MTAEEFWQKFYTEQIDNDTADGAIWEYKYDIKQIMIEFAQYHVKQCLLEASNKAEAEITWEGKLRVEEATILECYPDDRIK